uniref:non-specific protein-tyrosine kinase n=1 Tax=Ditylenchus dipsaci TaxID=166011 RepID=A0A915EEC7_9BILA
MRAFRLLPLGPKPLLASLLRMFPSTTSTTRTPLNCACRHDCWLDARSTEPNNHLEEAGGLGIALEGTVDVVDGHQLFLFLTIPICFFAACKFFLCSQVSFRILAVSSSNKLLMPLFSSNAKEDEQDIFYFHGNLPDSDVDKLLEKDGDFLIQSKHVIARTHTKLYLAIQWDSKVERREIDRLVDGFRLAKFNKSFGTLRSLVKYYYKHGISSSKGVVLQLKRPMSRSKYELTHKDIKLKKKIGSGAYGTVYRAIMVKTQEVVAVKRIAPDGKTDQALMEMMKEARVMQMYDHKNIVHFHGFIVSQAPYLLVMEYCSGGSLEDRLRSEGANILTARRVNYSMQGARGLEYIHYKNCIHRDIAARNCLLSGNVLKLADFGMCRATTIYKIDLSKPLNVWKTGETSAATDIYAFAILLWEMFTTPYEPPYAKWKAYEVKQRVISGYRLPPPSNMPDRMAVIMKSCWDHELRNRPKAQAVRKSIEEIDREYSNVETAVSTSQMSVVEA